MTDVLVPVFVPYARFLEVRARRLAIDTDVTPPDEHPTNVAVSSAPIANDESSAGAVVRVLTTAKVDGEQQIGVQIVAGRPRSRFARSQPRASDDVQNEMRRGGVFSSAMKNCISFASRNPLLAEPSLLGDGVPHEIDYGDPS